MTIELTTPHWDGVSAPYADDDLAKMIGTAVHGGGLLSRILDRLASIPQIPYSFFNVAEMGEGKSAGEQFQS